MIKFEFLIGMINDGAESGVRHGLYDLILIMLIAKYPEQPMSHYEYEIYGTRNENIPVLLRVARRLVKNGYLERIERDLSDKESRITYKITQKGEKLL